MSVTTTSTTVAGSDADRSPADSTLARGLLLAGPAYAVLLVVAAAAFPAPPHGDVSAATQPAWLAHHTGPVIAQAYVRGLAAVAFALMGVAVAVLARRLLGRTVLANLAAAGGTLTGILMLTSQAAALGSAQLIRDGGGADAVRSLGYLQEALLDMASLPAVLLFLATGLLALRTGLPRWLAGLSLLGVPLAVLDAASYDGGPLEAVGLVGLVYFLVWSLVAGIRLFRASSRRWVPQR